MNRITDEHLRRNADSRSSWEDFASHRKKVTDLLLGARSGGRRLCVLGAGNCNDLDLAALVAAYEEVHLVDLDDEALTSGRRQQRLDDNSCVHLHGGLDLSGIHEQIGNWSPDRSPSEAELQRCLDTANSSRVTSLPSFDVVASVCLLTQLFDSLSMSLDSGHTRFLELLTVIRTRHVRTLFELLRPGGSAILVSDFVSSTTCASLATARQDELPALAKQLINEQNFFTGANPAVLHALFKSDAVIAPQVQQVEVLKPWLWNFGPRTYAVFAIHAKSQPAAR